MFSQNDIVKYYKEDRQLLNFYNYIKSVSSDSTLETYMFGIINFLKFADLKGIDIYSSNNIQLYDYVSYLKENSNKSDRTIHLYVSAIKRYINYLNDSGHKIELVIPKLPKITVMSTRSSLNDEIIINYLKKVNSLFKEPYITLLSIMPYSGLRIEEAINLKLSDIINENGWFIFKVVGKGEKYREVPLLKDGNVILAKYLKGWRNLFYNCIEKRCIYLFPNTVYTAVSKRISGTTTSMPVSYTNVYAKVKRVAKIMGIKITPHTFRATYATKLSNSGVNTLTIMKLLGHSSSSTTAIYDRPSNIELINRIKDITY